MSAKGFLKWSSAVLAGVIIGHVGSILLRKAMYYVPSPPERVAAVPPHARWAGGADGGAWIACKPNGRRLWCEVYNEDGVAFEKGDFLAKFDSATPSRYSGGSIVFSELPLEREAR